MPPVDDIRTLVSVFVEGMLDAISIHRALPFLSPADTTIRNTILLCVGANGGLFLGSILLFDYVIAPLLLWFQHFLLGDNISSTSAIVTFIVDKSLHLTYLALWVLPIYVLVYLCSIFWYQDIADAAFTRVNGPRQSTSPERALRNELYRLLVWLLLLLQIWALATGLPAAVHVMTSIIHMIFGAVSGGGGFWLRIAVDQLLAMVTASLKLSGFLLTSVLYGLYPLEYVLVAQGLDPDQRYAHAEKYWVYFLGFGFPHALVSMVAGSYLMGYGLYAVAFPFCILLGVTRNASRSYKKHNAPPKPLPVFRTAQQMANKILRAIHLKANNNNSTSASTLMQGARDLSQSTASRSRND